MGRSGWRWLAVGAASLLLVLLGTHLAWEQHRNRLSTPAGTIRVGMTQTEARAVFSSAAAASLSSRLDVWQFDGYFIVAEYTEGRVASALFRQDGLDLQVGSTIPRPSLFAVVRSWLPGKRD